MGAAILLYHAVADITRDPFGIAVSPATFDAHMEIISKRYRPLTLSEVRDAAANGSLAPRSVAVTFDDGYANNLTEALPTLAKLSVPATVFVATGPVESGGEFWWDQLERLIFEAGRDASDTRTLTQRGVADLHHVRPGRHGPGGLGVAAPARARSDPSGARAVRQWTGRDEQLLPRDSHRPMTVGELHAISAHPLIEVGAQTRSHPALSARDLATQREEIAGGAHARDQTPHQARVGCSE